MNFIHSYIQYRNLHLLRLNLLGEDMKTYILPVLVFLMVFSVACENNQTSMNKPSNNNNAATPPVRYKKYDYRVTPHYVSKEVINRFDKAVLANPVDPMAYNDRAVTRFLTKDYKGAIEDCNKAIQIKSDFPYAYYYRALSNKHLDNKAEALKDFNTAKMLFQKADDKVFLNLIDEQISDISSKKQL